MRIGVAAGHSRNTPTPERLWEHGVCAMAARYLLAMLGGAGYDAITVLDSTYDLTNDDALRAKIKTFQVADVAAAIELHINAGGGDHSLSIYWSANTKAGYTYSQPGRSLAASIEQVAAVAYPWRTVGAKAQTTLGRSLGFLNQLRCPAVIVEPGFKDQPTHRAFFDAPQGPVAYAAAVFLGVQRYAQALG